MKTTYLLNKEQDDGTIRPTVVESGEWLSVVKLNSSLPADQRRYFIIDYIPEGDTLDRMVIEVPADDYREWNREHTASERNRAFQRSHYQLLSLDALMERDGQSVFSDIMSSNAQIDEEVCDQVIMDELRIQLAVWKPWANDLLDLYLSGEKKACTDRLAVKYNVSPQSVRKYKRQFESFVKNFFEGVSFSPPFCVEDK